MSRAAAVAMRDQYVREERAAEVRDKGLLAASTEALELERAAKIEAAKLGIVQLLYEVLGIRESEPFVLDDYDFEWPPEHRVCVRVELFLFTYRAGGRHRGRSYDQSLLLVVGNCPRCDLLPILHPIRTLADVARSDGREYERQVCSRCASAPDAWLWPREEEV
jgi:hypothetical protein